MKYRPDRKPGGRARRTTDFTKPQKRKQQALRPRGTVPMKEVDDRGQQAA